MSVDQQAPAGTVTSRFGPVPLHPVLDRVQGVVEETIRPAAVTTDRTEVPPGHLAALAATGLLGLCIPPEHGGLGVPADVAVEAHERIVAACPSTHLITSQHNTPAQWILTADRPTALHLLPALARGERVGGAAFGHVRSWPQRSTVEARREPGGWRFTGVAPWFSGAGLVDLLALGGVDPGSRSVVYAVVDLPQPEIREVPLDLVAIGGSRTVALELDGLFVPDERVTRVLGVDRWHELDGAGGLPAYPGAIGLARAAAGFALERYPDDESLADIADEITVLRSMVASSTAAGRDDLTRWRSHSVNLAVRATNAAVVARGGAALRAEDPVQVWARAAIFLQVRGLSGALRRAHFAQLARRPEQPSAAVS